MRGRKPVPTHLKVVRGNPGKRRLNKSEPLPIGDLSDAPRGLLKKLDRSVLVAWVVAEDLHRRSSEMVEKFVMLSKTPNTGVPMQSPYLPVLDKQAQIMLKAAE